MSPNSIRALVNRMLRALPPSMRTFLNRTLLMIGSSTSGKHPGYGISAHWSALLNVTGCSDQPRYLGSATVSYYDLPSSKLLLAFALGGGVSSKDCGNGLVGILESMSCILRAFLLLAIV